MWMNTITSRGEARNILECLSSTLIKAIVSIAIADVKTSRDLAKALNISIRNAQRVLAILEKLKVVKTVVYGRQKIIVSLNKYFEEEVIKAIEALVPVVISSLRVPALKIHEHYREIALAITKALGVDANPKNTFVNAVKRLLEKGLEQRPVPKWLKRLLSEPIAYSKRMASDSAEQPPLHSDIPLNVEVSELATY